MKRTVELERKLFSLLRASHCGMDYSELAAKLSCTTADIRYMVYAMRKRGMQIDTYFVTKARGEFIEHRKPHHPNCERNLLLSSRRCKKADEVRS